MALSLSSVAVDSKLKPSKIALGFLGAAMTALIGFAGVAGATSNKPANNNGNGHKNYSQQHLNQKAHAQANGGGYGGKAIAVNTGVNLNVNGNNNVITIVFKYIFGG